MLLAQKHFPVREARTANLKAISHLTACRCFVFCDITLCVVKAIWNVLSLHLAQPSYYMYCLLLGPWATYVDEAKVAKPSEVR